MLSVILFGLLVYWFILQFKGKRAQRWTVRWFMMAPVFTYILADMRAVASWRPSFRARRATESDFGDIPVLEYPEEPWEA